SEQVPAGRDEIAVPRDTHTVFRLGASTGDDRVLRVHGTVHNIPHVGAAHCPEHCRMLGGFFLLIERCAFEQAGDHDREHFDMGNFFGTDIQQHVTVLFRTATVPALEQV